jgi:hypothetical protein
MKQINYDKLMSANPYELDNMVNSYQQKVTFYEHPTQGDESPIIAVCHSMKQAFLTDFFDTEDMLNEDSDEYQPIFTGNDCVCFFELG